MRIVLNGLVRGVGPGEQALGIVQEVTVVSKRDQHLLDRHFQEAREALVVALDAGVWPAAGSVDTDLGSLSLLELDRTDIPERRVSAQRVVEALDVVEHIAPDFFAGSVYLSGHAFCLH